MQLVPWTRDLLHNSRVPRCGTCARHHASRGQGRSGRGLETLLTLTGGERTMPLCSYPQYPQYPEVRRGPCLRGGFVPLHCALN
jgi:hypothetical protein